MAATKLTITIPDDLAERLDPVRDKMNISKVCAAAIDREVSMLADLPVDVQELAATIARLRAEKAEAEQEDYNTGLEWGQQYAEGRASYAELMDYASIPGRIDPITLDELPEEEREGFAEQRADWGLQVVNPDRFARGWLDGLLAVWGALKGKV
jgi:predicted transcriptional regulator